MNEGTAHPDRKQRVLFLCTHNACRSQIAEGLCNARFADRCAAQSAGSAPSQVHPLAVQVLREWGIDIAHHRSKSVEEFVGSEFDWVVSLCDDSQGTCPFFLGQGRRIHKAFDDPSLVSGTEGERLAAFRRTRDAIEAWLQAFFTVPPKV